eukprot:TRINITY_DN3873_c3_g2_i1.p1 TRINITY_DN3873_c3_g2~~TRINITY_DN3873_c3_g2_i1.p1  ORF type:complete len:286 (-),score=12.88 TRINITY_DN3873_c3_g2_i1:109-966(-)
MEAQTSEKKKKWSPKPGLYLTEVLPRLSTAGFATGSITIERCLSQVVNTSEGRIPHASWSHAAQLFKSSILKHMGLVSFQYFGTRELKHSLDQVLPYPAISMFIACGALGVPCSSLQYNWAIQDTYRLFKFDAPRVSSFSDFWRAKVSPGLVWCFARASFGTGGSLYYGPSVTAHIDSLVNDAGSGKTDKPSMLIKCLGGFITGACGSLATQNVHNITLVAGRMAALGETHGAPYFTRSAMITAWKEMGFGIFYLNFPQRTIINAVTISVLNMCDIFHRPDISGW